MNYSMGQNIEYEKLKEAKELFISITSHKLLTPVTLMKWNLELLKKDESLSESAKEKVKDIDVSVQKLDKFSNILLKIVQAKADSTVTNKVNEINVFALLEKISQQHKESNIKINNNLSSPLSVYINELELEYVIESLIDNADLYNTSDKNIEVNINVDDKNLILNIKDDGIGIPENEIPLIGEAFFRTSNSQKLSVKGFGLSLYLVSIVLKNAGGKFEVKSSELNKGSEFEITLPLVSKLKG